MLQVVWFSYILTTDLYFINALVPVTNHILGWATKYCSTTTFGNDLSYPEIYNRDQHKALPACPGQVKLETGQVKSAKRAGIFDGGADTIGEGPVQGAGSLKPLMLSPVV